MPRPGNARYVTPASSPAWKGPSDRLTLALVCLNGCGNIRKTFLFKIKSFLLVFEFQFQSSNKVCRIGWTEPEAAIECLLLNAPTCLKK